MINIRFNVSKRYFYNSKEIPKYIVNIIIMTTPTIPTFNKFKSTTIYGAFNNLDYEDNTIQASSNIQRNLTVGGDLSCNGIINGNKLYYNGMDISSNFLQKDEKLNKLKKRVF